MSRLTTSTEYRVTACVGKDAFDTQTLAAKVADRMRTSLRGRRPVRPYRCSACGKWHIGSKT